MMTTTEMFELYRELIYYRANNKCVIFSFAIADDWRYQDMINDLKCVVYAFAQSFKFNSKRRRTSTFV